MFLLEYQERSVMDNGLYNVSYKIEPVVGLNDTYNVIRKWDYSGTQLSGRTNGEKDSYMVRLTPDELNACHLNIEALFKFLELRYKRQNIWFKYSDGTVTEFEEDTNIESVLCCMSVILYTNNHIIYKKNNPYPSPIEIFIGPSEKTLMNGDD